MSPSSRRSVLVLGETLLLWLVCLPIVGYDALFNLITKLDPRALQGVNHLTILLQSLLIPVACQLSFSFQDLYEWRVTNNRDETSIRLLRAIFYAGILLGLVHYGVTVAADVFERPQLTTYVNNPWTTLAALVAALPLSYFYRIFFHWSSAHWNLNERILLLGNGSMARTLEEELRQLNDPGYEIVGFVGRDREGPTDLEASDLGPMQRLNEVAQKHRVNMIVVTLAERRGQLPTIELLNCRLAGMRIEDGEQLYERLTGKIAVQRLRPSYLIFSEGFQRSKVVFAIKRIMDVIAAVIGIILLFPLCLAAAIAIKFDSRGPVFYGQARVGKDGRIFTTYKFRTMRTDAEAAGPQWAGQNDPRITRVGQFLRRTRIDEIPQMWNVLRNEMSFVGPRPERPFFVEELRKQIPYYMERLLVKPGITGWAQINYQYGNTIGDALTKLQYDLYYIKNLSIYLDVLTMLRTVKVVVLRRGAV